MPKARKARAGRAPPRPDVTRSRAQPQSIPQKQEQKQRQKPKQNASTQRQQASQRAPIPFDASDDILLVGEGDFSFAHSLLLNHATRFNTLTATTLETRGDLMGKHPQAEAFTYSLLLASTPGDSAETFEAVLHDMKKGHANRPAKVPQNEDPASAAEDDNEQSFEGFSPPSSPPPTTAHTPPVLTGPSDAQPPDPSTTIVGKGNPLKQNQRYTINYTTDATKLSTYKYLRHTPGRSSPLHGFSKIIFNFPHVGGKSTDVNRQVRYNQEMLHKFLGEAKILLERRAMAAREIRNREGSERRLREAQARNGHGGKGKGDGGRGNEVGNGEERKSERYSTPPSSEDEDENAGDRKPDGEPTPERRQDAGSYPKILVTLFESHPYTLWNIRDLARAQGLECRRSWKFEWSDYPGYRHARTLGNLRPTKEKVEMEGEEGMEVGEDDENDEGGKKETGKGAGWKGEQREARTYEFGLKAAEGGGGGRKRKRSNGHGDESASD